MQTGDELSLEGMSNSFFFLNKKKNSILWNSKECKRWQRKRKCGMHSRI